MYPLHNITPTTYSEWRSPLLSHIFFHNRQKHSAINHLWATMITQTSSSIYNYWTKIIASKSKTIAITTFAYTNDTSELIFFSKSIFRIFQITLILLYTISNMCAIFERLCQSTLCPYNSQTEPVVKPALFHDPCKSHESWTNMCTFKSL